MADKTPEQEPSIEEILASIRQIISDDEDKDPASEPVDVAPAAPAAPEPKPEPKKPEPVAAAVPEPVAPPKAAPAPEPVYEPEEELEDDVLELVDAIEEEDEEEPPVIEEPRIMPEKSKDDALLSNSARQATIASMAKLAGNVPINRSSSYGSVTLEDIVREMLQPMLRDWMNDNLPPMVERIVQKELEKLARRALDE